ncbi:hypothetical protein IFM89_008527 [Coptis chinensis]|uniref:Cytochrome P450 n=1 Tax=Coptis chinensis TaxID=261450 RepID=A0A835LUW1_9MAGN|nr:hypothetical protein IFM89_008527 [Coptis chinensis]
MFYRFSDYGPPSYPFIGCIIAFYNNRYRLLDWYTDLLAKSPTQTIVVQRLGARRTIVTANPENIEHILKTNFNNFPKGKPFTEILGDLLGSGIFNVDGDLWHTQRKLASHGFTTKSLREFVLVALEDEVGTRLLPMLEKAAKTSEVIDLQEVLKRFAFDVVCKFSLGIDPACLEPSNVHAISPLAKAFDIASEISARRGAAPVSLVWKIKRIFCISSEQQLKEAIGDIHEFVTEIIKNKKKAIQETNNEEKNADLLTQLILAGRDESFIRDMVISFIMAGKDTTSAAMTWLFWLLSRHPHIEKQLADEVKKTSNRTTKRFIEYEGLKEMRLLKACLCEGMRLYPPVAWDSKHALNNDTLPDGTMVRAGDRVTYFPYGMGRMETLWGKNCFEFKPDRWFVEPDKEGGELRNVCPYKFPVFQGGPRICLGKEMAFLQMKYLVGSVLDQFEIKPVGSGQPVFVPLLTAHMAGGLKVMVQPRSPR